MELAQALFPHDEQAGKKWLDRWCHDLKHQQSVTYEPSTSATPRVGKQSGERQQSVQCHNFDAHTARRVPLTMRSVSNRVRVFHTRIRLQLTRGRAVIHRLTAFAECSIRLPTAKSPINSFSNMMKIHAVHSHRGTIHASRGSWSLKLDSHFA